MGYRNQRLLTCEEVRDRVYPLLLRTVTAAERQEILGHAERCESCRFLLDATRARLEKIVEVDSKESGQRRRRPVRRWLILLTALPAVVAYALLIGQGIQVGRYRYEHRFVSRLEKALWAYRDDFGQFPPGDGSPLSVYLGTRERGGPYLDLAVERLDAAGYFVDHWGNRYEYRARGVNNSRSFDLRSNGRNRVDDGGRGDDIANWDPGFRRIEQERRDP